MFWNFRELSNPAEGEEMKFIGVSYGAERGFGGSGLVVSQVGILSDGEVGRCGVEVGEGGSWAYGLGWTCRDIEE